MAPPPSAPTAISPAPPAPPKRPRNFPPIVARLTVDNLRGDVGFVSEDIWRDVFGFKKDLEAERRRLIDGDEEPEDEPIAPTLHLAITPLASAASAKRWTILPVTLLPSSSQFPSLPPSTVLLPDSINKGSLATLSMGPKKAAGVLIVGVNPTQLETVLVSVRVAPSAEHYESDHDLEDRVKDALGKLRIIHSGEELALNYGRGSVSRRARVALCEPVDQGLLRPETKVVIVKDQNKNRRRRDGAVDGVILAGEDDSDDLSEGWGSSGPSDGAESDSEEDEVEFSSFVTAPPTSARFSFPSISSTPAHMRNGIQSPNLSISTGPTAAGRVFKPQPLTGPIPPGLLHPKPKELDDEEARVYVKVGDLAKLGCFSGDWVRVSVATPPSDSMPTSPLRMAAESVARTRGMERPSSRGRPVNGSRAVGSKESSDMPDGVPEEVDLGRPVRVYSLPEGWEGPHNKSKMRNSKSKGKENGNVKIDSGRVLYLSPILLANTSSTSPAPDLLLTPINVSTTPSVLNAGPLSPPSAKEVTLLRIASPTSTDRALQPSFLLQLKSYFESCRRLVKIGDMIAVSIDEVLARSLNGDAGEEGLTEELLASEGRGQKTCVAWFRVGNITSSTSEETGSAEVKSPTTRRPETNKPVEEAPWGSVVVVDPASTRMVQAGSEKRKIPPMLSSTWEHYLGLHPLPLRQSAIEKRPPQIVTPTVFVSQTLRRLRELVAAATSLRAVQLRLQPIAILLTSTQRSIGKRILAQRAAADVGVHVFHIDAYDIIADGGAGDSKTEAFLRARVERAQSCGREACVLLITHIEALTAGRMGEVLKDLISEMKIVIATTTEVDKLSETVRNVFTHEMEVAAPDEKERAALLQSIVDEKRISLGRDADLSAVAVKTAALVAGDLADVVDRAVAASKSRITGLARRLRKTSVGLPQERPTIDDLELAGGDAVTAVCKVDFDTAVDAARRNFSDSIGAPRIPNVSWDDVGGLANVKSAVMETIQLPLERPELFAQGMKKRSGILFYGPPGTGKTLLAKAIATEFSLNFFSIKGPELLNMYIGESEANVRRVFQRARDARPCVVFFDELDSVAPKRGNQGDSGGVMDRIVSQLLAELDGMSEGKEGSGGVFVIGATNRPDLLDPALLRPGRFDKMLYLGVSDTHEKQYTILQALTRKFTLHSDLNLFAVAETLPFNYTGADLYALCSDAMLKAITRQAQRVDAKIKAMETPVSTAWFFDNLATPKDVMVVVEEQDFWEAKNELVASVSAGELEHYKRVRSLFEQPEKKDDGKGKGKGKAREENGDVDGVLEANGAAAAAPVQWEDTAAKDEEELYG